MSSISDTLRIASQAVEHALTASSAKKVDPTTHLSGIHNHKEKAEDFHHSGKKLPTQTQEDVIKETEKVIVNRIDLRV